VWWIQGFIVNIKGNEGIRYSDEDSNINIHIFLFSSDWTTNTSIRDTAADITLTVIMASHPHILVCWVSHVFLWAKESLIFGQWDVISSVGSDMGGITKKAEDKEQSTHMKKKRSERCSRFTSVRRLHHPITMEASNVLIASTHNKGS